MENLPTRNNNPGDLRDPSTGNFKQFADPKQGYAALLNDLHGKQVGTTTTGLGPSSSLTDFAKTYAPPSDNNNSAKYAADLANQLGVRPDAQLKDLDLGKWASAVAKNEGYQGNPQDNKSNTQTQNTTEQPNQPTPQPTDNKGLLEKGLDFFAPVVNDISSAVQGKGNGKTALQVLGDVGTTALTAASFIPGLGELGPVEATAARLGLAGAKGLEGAEVASKVAPGLLKTAGKTALTGAGYGASSSLGAGETDPTKIAESGLIGGATGGALGVGGAALGKIANVLPQRIVRSFIPGINEDTAKYATTKTLGSASKMLADSDSSIQKLGNSLGAALKNPSQEYVQPSGQEILSKVAESFPQSGLGADDIVANLKRLIPLKAKLVDKLASGEDMTLEELHQLNSAIGQATYKSVFDDPAMKAGKEIANSAYHTISDVLKTASPETIPLFDQLSKEYALNKGLQKALRSGQKSKAITLKDILALTAGFTASGGNPLGALGALGIEKAATNPTVNLKTAGLISKLAKPGARKVGNAVASPILRGVGLLNSGSPK